MSLNEHIATLTAAISDSMVNGNMLKLTLSNKRSKTDDLNNVFVKPVMIKDQTLLSFVYRHSTRDVTKNFTIEDAVDQIAVLLSATFFNADLFTSAADYSHLQLIIHCSAINVAGQPC